jgi:hypothetical protein
MSAPSARPPSFPRPSSALAKSRLKDRLLCVHKRTSNSPKRDGGFEGIGETQFDRFDDEETSSSLHLNEKNLTRHEQNLRNTTNETVSTAVVLPTKPVRPDTTSTQHTVVARTIHDNPKWDRIATSLASGSTEFCYMEEMGDNNYKFSFSSIPKKRNFSTLSRYGLLRMHDKSVEKVSLDEFMYEHHLHAKLLKIKVFGKFRMWKTLFCWRHNVRQRKFKRAVSNFSLLEGGTDCLACFSGPEFHKLSPIS